MIQEFKNKAIYIPAMIRELAKELIWESWIEEGKESDWSDWHVHWFSL